MGIVHIKNIPDSLEKLPIYYCDVIEDVDKILKQFPNTKPGAEAYCLSSNVKYILNSQKQWVIVPWIINNQAITYASLQDKPEINGIVIEGRKSAGEYNLAPLMPTLNIQKLEDYLYTINFYDYDYELAQRKFKEMDPFRLGACSGVVKDHLMGRNYDWLYDNASEFIIRTTNSNGRFASIGIANGSSIITLDMFDGKFHPEFNILPFLTLDGVNENHVSVTMNVVPTGDKGRTLGTKSGAERMNIMCAPRFILDYAENAEHAVELMLNSYDWFSPQHPEFNDELHLMIADPKRVYILEFVDNKIKVFSNVYDSYGNIPKGLPIMTNFYIDGWDGEIVTGFDKPQGIRPEQTTLTAHAQGLERYNILKQGYLNISNEESMARLMKQVKFTKAYDPYLTQPWYSEFVEGPLTIYDNSIKFEDILKKSQAAYRNKDRNKPQIWQTVHTTVYNMNDLTLTVYPQEHDKGYTVSLNDIQ